MDFQRERTRGESWSTIAGRRSESDVLRESTHTEPRLGALRAGSIRMALRATKGDEAACASVY